MPAMAVDMTPNLYWYRSGILHFKRIFEEEELQEGQLLRNS